MYECSDDWSFPSNDWAGFVSVGGAAEDNCDDNLTASYTTSGPTGTCPTEWTLTWTIADDCGNDDTCQQLIQENDTTDPEITCPPDLEFDSPRDVVYPENSWAGFIAAGGAATDNCDDELEAGYTMGDPQGECPTIVVLTWTVTDDCENTDTCDQTITINCPPGEYCTYTQGGWGSKCPRPQQDRPYSTQPGCIRDHFFDEVFPDGVMIGVQGVPGLHYAYWADSAAVRDFLPAGSTPGYLTEDLPNNPTSTPAGVLAGQLLALRLNMAYSCAGVFTELELLPEVGCFGEYIIEDCGSMFDGMRVDAFLAMADSAVGGYEGYRHLLSKFNETATCLNEMFDECKQPDDEEFPDPDSHEVVVAASDASGLGNSFQLQSSIPDVFTVGQSYPNPFSGSVNIGYGLPTNGWVKVEIFDVAGRRVVTLEDADKAPGYHRTIWSGKDDQGRRVAPGVYFYQVSFQGKAEVKKMMLIE